MKKELDTVKRKEMKREGVVNVSKTKKIMEGLSSVQSVQKREQRILPIKIIQL